MRDKPTHVVGEHECRRRRGSHARPSRPGDRAFPGGLISIPPGAIDPEQTYIDGATNFADAVLVDYFWKGDSLESCFEDMGANVAGILTPLSDCYSTCIHFVPESSRPFVEKYDWSL